MSFKQHAVKVSKVLKLNKDAVAIYLDIPDELKETFKYSQGQFLSIQVNINGENYRREYSICSSPYYENDLVISSKKIGNGIVSNYFYNSIKENDILEVYPPQGKFFTTLNSANEKNYFLIGGGSGITPLMSILKSVLFVEPKSKVILYYGSKDEDGIIFKDELIQLQQKYSDRLKIFFTLSDENENWKGLKGMINSNDLLKLVNDNTGDKSKDTEYFICGPVEMMEKVKNYLSDLKVEHNKIHIEYFTAPVHHEEYIPAVEDEILDDTKEREVHIILDGSEHKIIVKPGVSILNSAIKADLDPPFSCKSGICTTCRAKLYSGKVKMDEREGLSDAEIAEGYILTCQSHPLTDNVKLEYM